MLIAVRYLGNDTITGINQIEDWYLPSDAFKTQFKDAAGRTLYLVGTKEQILKEDARMDKSGAIVDHFGYIFTYAGPKVVAKPAPVVPSVANVAPVVVPPVVVAPVANVVANTANV